MNKYISLLIFFGCAILFVLLKDRSYPPVIFPESKPCIPTKAIQVNPATLVEQIYLGDTALGIPFYLNVQLFELHGKDPAELVAWHLNALSGPCEAVFVSDKRKVYIRRGTRNPERPDTTHGFAALEGERALFLDCYETGGNLYICTAEAPLDTFLAHEKFLRGLCAEPR